MKSLKELYDECSSKKLIVNGKVQRPWIAYGYCSDCGIGNCEHLQKLKY